MAHWHPPTLDELLYESNQKHYVHPLLPNEELLDAIKKYLENRNIIRFPIQQLTILRENKKPFRMPDSRFCHYAQTPKAMSSSIDQALAGAMPWLWIGANKIWGNPSTNRKNDVMLLYAESNETTRLRIYNDASKGVDTAKQTAHCIYINLCSPIGKTPEYHCLMPKKFRAYTDASIRFCVLRDPVERFFSSWQDLRRRYPKRFGALTDPEKFFHVISHIDTRKEYRDIHHLTQTWFLGKDPSYYTHIFSMRDVARLEAFLSEISGKPIILPHAHRSTYGDKVLDIPAPFRQRIEAHYAQDYKIWGKYF